MKSTASAIGLIGLPDLALLRVERDRALALAYVRLGQTPDALKKVIAESGINYRTVYRAVARELEWAKAEHEKAPGETGASDDHRK